MTIRPKVIVLVAASLLVLGASQILVEQQVVMPSFAELEHDEAQTAMRRISYAFDQALDRLALSAADWGNWEDTWRYIIERDPAYVRANATDVGLKQLQVNAIVLIDAAGRFVMAKTLDLNSDQPLDIDFVGRGALPADFPWRAHLSDGQIVRGFIRTNRGIMMIAGAPVLDGNGGGPQRGMVLLGRLLSGREIRRIGSQAQAALVMVPATATAGLQPGEVTETAQTAQVLRPVADVYGTTLAGLRVDLPRLITRRGHAAIVYATLCLLAAAVVVLVVLVGVLNRVVLQPLAQVTRHAVSIDDDLQGRLDLKGDDEFARLAREFDRMVERLADSRRQVVDQSFQAGFAELARGVLHNIGNAITPVGVRLAGLAQRLRQAPTADAEQACAELENGNADAARRSDLQQFVLMACREFATVIDVAQADVALLTRQAGVVQSALAEQLTSTRNEHVIEPVRLPELIGQALEIVPDACRQRLQIELDDSLARLGVLQLARTVLRLVLQNLIINAADAVRDAGKERGTLRISAQIHQAEDSQQLVLCCQDDGGGIAPENLERLFEKGFSTKSRNTNFGIGLHWCANVLRALGGRIWASSEGAGRGAALHLSVPLAARRPESHSKAA
ncbi:MAG TPA: CHASE4 domain-containing protein [Steroidobacteraceae bacterium]|jgi:signal transduction histidine kinase